VGKPIGKRQIEILKWELNNNDEMYISARYTVKMLHEFKFLGTVSTGGLNMETSGSVTKDLIIYLFSSED
jgi:hypothetical protein